MRPGAGSFLQPLPLGRFNLGDLRPDPLQPLNRAQQLGQDVWRQHLALRGAQHRQALRRRLRAHIELGDAVQRQQPLHAIDQTRRFADQAVTLAQGPLAVLRFARRHRHHAAVLLFAAQPAEIRALQQTQIEPVRLRPSVLARHRHAGRMDDMTFDAARPQPAGQPEAVAPGLVSNTNPRDRAARRRRFIAPPIKQPKQPGGIWGQLLHRLPLHPRNHTPDQPTRAAQFDYRNQRAILIEGDEGPAEVVKLRHEALHWRGRHRWATPSPLAP